jgi:hypothetical protein
MPKPERNGTESVVAVDRDRLDEEWITQPQNYEEAAEDLAEAKFAADQAKAALDVAKAESELDVRNRPVEYHIEKVTEGVVAAHVARHPNVKKATETCNKKRYRVNILEAKVRALEHKKTALENLVVMGIHLEHARPKDRSNTDYEDRVIANRRPKK